MDSLPDISDSQGSSLDLSQGTMNTLIFSLGGNSAINGLMGTEFERIQTEADDPEAPIGASEVTMNRAIIRTIPSTASMPQWSNSQPFSQGATPFATQNGATQALTHGYTPPVTTNGSSLPLGHQQFPQPSAGFSAEPLSTTLLTPPQTLPLRVNQSAYHISPPSSHEGTPAPNPALSHTSRLPFPGDLGFQVVFDDLADGKANKSACFTYSKLVSRAYMRPRQPITFHFSFQSQPPMSSIIRATPIYNSPELAAQHVYCCLADSHQVKEKGQLYPSHFIRPFENKAAVFSGDAVNQPSSVALPLSVLSQDGTNKWYAVYTFPCVNSHLPHKKNVEIMFTLEDTGAILGRCLVKVRVCTSPGRDRTLDEKKAGKGDSRETTPINTPQSRKRGAEGMVEVTQCTLPPKRFCLQLTSPKVPYTIMTHPELIPSIDVCVKMMEQMHNVNPLPQAPPSTPPARELYASVEAWLDVIGMRKYADIFKNKGITRLYQVPNITDEELKEWGVRTAAHRKKILSEKDKVLESPEERRSLSTQSSVEQDGPGSPQLFPSSPPKTEPNYLTRYATRQISQGSGGQSSQESTGSSGPYSHSFEVLSIQMKKKISSSSNESH